MAVPRVCIDRLLPSEQMRFQRTIQVDGADRAIIPIGKLWMNGSTLHVRFIGGTETEHAKVRQQAQWWADHANLTFVFDDAADADIRISFDTSDGAWSYLGTDCRSIPMDQPTMNLGFLTGGTPAHEFGHAIGLAHEHQNPQGGIEWNEAKVIRDLSGPPNFWSVEQIRHNVLRKYRVDQIKGTEFDPDSIMLYFFPGSWTTSGQGTKANTTLSVLDKSYVASAEAYPRALPPASKAKRLAVDAPRRTRATIGKPGEEDLYSFVVETGGSYVIDTLGSSDLVMKLFGPDSETALVAEDDDSGVGLNPRIAADLLPGTYFAQVRHYRSDAAGVGKYTVKVYRPKRRGA